MSADDTLIGRCTVAYSEAFEAAITSPAVAPGSRRAGVAAVLEHLAAEIAVMLGRAPGLTVHQIITILRLEAAGEIAGWEHESA